MDQKKISPKNKTKRCPKGERMNPKTGLCEKVGAKEMPEIPKKTEKPEKITKPCPPGKILNPKTNRCINIPKETKEKTSNNKTVKKMDVEKREPEEPEEPEEPTKPCPPGKILNPKTNRCINIPKETKEKSSNNKTVKKMDVEKREPEKTEEPEKTKKIVRKKNTTKMSIKESKMFETRKKCIQGFREKLPKLSLKNVE